MIIDILRHWRYFIPRFLGYGTVLGILFGGLTYPILGMFIGAPWGFLGGLLLGILMGIGVPVYNRFFAPDDADKYQLHLSFGAGMLAIVVMALPLLFIFALPAGMVTAYVSHKYAEDPTIRGEKRKHSADLAQRRDKVFTKAAGSMMSTAKWVIGLLTLGGIGLYTLASFLDPYTTFEWFAPLTIGIGGLIYGSMVASLIAAVNALFIVFANRLFFKPDTPKSEYKARIVPIVGVLTLFLSMIVTFGIGAPFAAIAGAFGAAKFTDWYYDEDEEADELYGIDHLADEWIEEDVDYRYESRKSNNKLIVG